MSILMFSQLHQLYLHPANGTLVSRLYVTPNSTNPLVNVVTATQLRRAAEEEIRKSNALGVGISEAEIMLEGRDSLRALESVLGEGKWFFGAEEPGLFDAAVFAYTWLILDGDLGWAWNALGEELRSCDGLVRHRESMAKRCAWL